MAVVLLTADLMLGSQVSQTSKQNGWEVRVSPSEETLLDACEHADVAMIILDLSHSQVRVRDLVPAIRKVCGPDTKILAIASHVHTAKIEAAREAGCDEVLTRGQFHANMVTVLAGP